MSQKGLPVSVKIKVVSACEGYGGVALCKGNGYMLAWE
jgi:hypothetical protein